jgi:hypothetical protein
MWWLSFRDGSAAVIEATSLLHARMLAAVHKIGRVGQFVDGYELSPELEALIPEDCIGRLLSRDDAWQLYDQLARDRAASTLSDQSEIASVQKRSGPTARRFIGSKGRRGVIEPASGVVTPVRTPRAGRAPSR